MAFDLEDPSRWEPLLYGALSRRTLALCVCRKKEREMMSRLLKKEEQEEVCMCVLYLCVSESFTDNIHSWVILQISPL